MLIELRRLLVPFTLLIAVDLTSSAPKTWPYMKTYDIWETNKTVDTYKERPTLVDNLQNIDLLNGQRSKSLTRVNGRKAKGESS